MFGPGDSNAERKALLESTDSLLDYVRDASKSLSHKLGPSDRALVNDYLESVREVELRVQKLMAKADSLGNLPNAPLGAPDDFTELLDVQFEMIALAFQTNQTRIATMRMIKEASMRTFPQVNVDEAFHPLSHHAEDPEKHERLVRVQAYQTERFARFAKRLASIKEGNGNLLDNSIILFGSNMANSDLHNNNPLPQLLLGKGGGIKGGQHLAMPKGTPHANATRTGACWIASATTADSRCVSRLDVQAPRQSISPRMRSHASGRTPFVTRSPMSLREKPTCSTNCVVSRRPENAMTRSCSTHQPSRRTRRRCRTRSPATRRSICARCGCSARADTW
jgi:hypothetical protein